MITLEELRKKANRTFEKYLIHLVTGGQNSEFFPKEIPFRSLSTKIIYQDLQQAILDLLKHAKGNTDYGPIITLKMTKTRNFGLQSLPDKIVFESEDDLSSFISKTKELDAFLSNLALTKNMLPTCLTNLSPKALISIMLNYSDRWFGILEVCQYLYSNPKPNLYLRELPIKSDTKFIERNIKPIKQILRAILAPEHYDSEARSFEDMFYLQKSPSLVRIKFLDDKLHAQLNIIFNDFSLRLSDMNQLPVADNVNVLIVENLTTYASLPELKDTIAIFGAGLSAILLDQVKWVHKAKVYYWGDIDAQGLEILSQIAQRIPHTVPLLMDEDTCMRFSDLCTPGVETGIKETPGLNDDLRSLYIRLVKDNLRLEQEKLPSHFCNKVLTKSLQTAKI